MKRAHRILSLSCVLGLMAVASPAKADVMVHMFQWKFNDIANECEKVLGPKGFGSIQITPPAEHVNKSDTWWSVYQPVNLANFNSYGGSEAELRSMITRCNKAGVKIYADAVFNNWAAYNGGGIGTGGSSWSSANYPRFSGNDFHAACSINSYGDRYQVQNCRLSGMPDLNTGSDYVQSEVATYMKTLLGWGVAGFRIDAAKHMSVSDLSGILGKAGNPKVYLEVIGADGEAIQPNEYLGLGYVTEFKYTARLKEQFNGQIKNLKTFGESWGMMSSGKSQVFVTNHDNERGSAGTTALTYKDGNKYYLANTFMMAWPYGWPQVLSSYHFNGHDDGAPSTPGCGNGWVCQQRNPAIMNMALFHNKSEGQGVTNWWDNGNNQIAFGRGNKGFVVINNEGGAINQSFQTSLAAGEYCQILAGNDYCSGSYVTVDGSGKATFSVKGMSAAAIVEGCTKADSSGCGGSIVTDPDPEDPTDPALPVARFSTMNFRGTPNSWAATPMSVDSQTRVWSLIVNFTGTADSAGAQRFKFDVAGNWLENYGDNEGDGIADKNSLKDIYFTGVGKYLVTLKESDMSYTLTPVMENQAPKAVLTPQTITIKQGDQVVFDARGSSDDVGITAYMWSTGGNGETETITFDTVGSHQVVLTVYDAEGLEASAIATVIVEKATEPDSFLSNYSKVSFRGTNNGWASQDMELVADHTWQTTVNLSGSKNERFKIDATGASGTQAWGDRNDDGKMEHDTSIFPGYRGIYTLTVNDQTMVYELQKQGAPHASNLASLYYIAPKASGKGWDYTPMHLMSDNLWYVRVKWSDVANQRFRFDIGGKGIRTDILGDSNKDGIVEEGGLPIYQRGKGYFIIKLNDRSMKYSIVEQ